MADWDKDKPADNDLISQYPQNERDARDAVRSNFGVDHRNTDDADVGKHELLQLLAQTTPTAAAGQGHFYTKDTGSGQIELFHQDESGNETQITDRGLSAQPFEAGTKCVFYQASAPTGWTQDTSVNDRVLRIVSGSGGGTGGSWTISGLGQGNLSVDGHQLSISEIPSHNHGGGNHSHAQRGDPTTTGATNSVKENTDGSGTINNLNNTAGSGTIISTEGGDGSHSHGLSGSPDQDGTWRPSHIDVIVASKD